MPRSRALVPGERRTLRTEHSEVSITSSLRQHDQTLADVVEVRIFPNQETNREEMKS